MSIDRTYSQQRLSVHGALRRGDSTDYRVHICSCTELRNLLTVAQRVAAVRGIGNISHLRANAPYLKVRACAYALQRHGINIACAQHDHVCCALHQLKKFTCDCVVAIASLTITLTFDAH